MTFLLTIHPPSWADVFVHVIFNFPFSTETVAVDFLAMSHLVVVSKVAKSSKKMKVLLPLEVVVAVLLP